SGYPISECIAYLEQEPVTKQSSVLQEKLAELYDAEGKLSDEIDAYEAALKLHTSPQQRIRIMLALAGTLTLFTQEEKALTLYRRFLKEFPDYPDPLGIYRKMLPLAVELKKTEEAQYLQKEIERLSPPTRQNKTQADQH
ncbi:MAG TPA: tetratricopeptide repeat protein, partial [Candidatus Nitrosotalea sp.]|nr:tetratricopeptide repeat protein [Candidatus Nitrosotalea sp.]